MRHLWTDPGARFLLGPVSGACVTALALFAVANVRGLRKRARIEPFPEPW
ncbi:hypothetical protein [Frigoriglobus tundricola]|nr:hypothetical protein [Frigoriglobus tundricola]